MPARGRTGRWAAVATAAAALALALALSGIAAAQSAPAHAPRQEGRTAARAAGSTTAHKAATPVATPASSNATSNASSKAAPKSAPGVQSTAPSVAASTALRDQPELAGVYVPSAPVRLLDTRNGTGSGVKAKVGQTPVQLDVSGVSGDPAVTPTAVVLNVTVTGATNAGHLAVYPGDQQPPATSNLNFSAGQTVPNLVTVPVGADGQIAFVDSFGSTDVIADLAGYYTASTSGGTYVPLSTFTATLYTASGSAVFHASGGTRQEVNSTVYLYFDVPKTLPAGSYTLGFTLTDAGALSTSYGTPDGTPVPGGPLVMTVTAG